MEAEAEGGIRAVNGGYRAMVRGCSWVCFLQKYNIFISRQLRCKFDVSFLGEREEPVGSAIFFSWHCYACVSSNHQPNTMTS